MNVGEGSKTRSSESSASMFRSVSLTYALPFALRTGSIVRRKSPGRDLGQNRVRAVTGPVSACIGPCRLTIVREAAVRGGLEAYGEGGRRGSVRGLLHEVP